jgi:hypothetical protein
MEKEALSLANRLMGCTKPSVEQFTAPVKMPVFLKISIYYLH